MFYAAAPIASPGVDILTIAVTAVVTAAGAVVAAMFGARMQARREHTKWVRERRYDAYVAFAALVASVVMSKQGGLEPAQPQNMQENLQAIFILGPPKMVNAANRLVKAEDSGVGYAEAVADYQRSAAKVLGINK